MLRLRRSRGDAQHERAWKSQEGLPFALSVAQRSRRADARILSPLQKGFLYNVGPLQRYVCDLLHRRVKDRLLCNTSSCSLSFSLPTSQAQVRGITGSVTWEGWRAS